MNLKGDVFPEAGQGLKSQNFPREKRRQTAEHLESHGECRDPQLGDSSYVLVGGGVPPESWKLLGLWEGGDQNGYYYGRE